MLGRKDLFRQTEGLLDQGFLFAYSQASLEEDVNMFIFAVIDRPTSLYAAIAAP